MKEISYDGHIESADEILGNKRSGIRSAGSEKVPPLRTYRADVTEMMTRQGTTKTDVVQAETARREARSEPRVLHETPTHTDSHLGRTIFILSLLLAIGLGVGIYAFVGFRTTAPTPGKIVVEMPITSDVLTIDLTNSPREQIFADITIAFGKTSLPQGGKRSVQFMLKDAAGSDRPATTQEFLRAISILPPPEKILSSLDGTFSFDIRADVILQGVLSVPTRSYAASFGALYDWEANIADEFMPVVNPLYPRKDIVLWKDRPFRDVHRESIDARVLMDPEGRVLICYGFAGKKTLLIAGSIGALDDAAVALAASK